MKRIIFSAGLLACLSFARAQDTIKADATLMNATVYFGYGAELTHQAKLRTSTSTRFIIINKLSTSIDVNSLQISVPEDVALLSHRYNIHYPVTPAQVKSQEMQKLIDSIELTKKTISRTENNIAIERETLNKTGLLIESTVASAGTKGITATELVRLIDLYTARIEKSKTNIFNFQQAISLLHERIADLNKRMSELTNANPVVSEKPYGQLILQVMSKQAGEIPVSLSYYTNNAGWTPTYDVRVNSKTNKVKLVYKASIMQSTGIDWKKTPLTLSTGTPSFGVAAPVLAAWYLQLYVPGIYTDLQRRAAAGNAQRNMMQSMKDDKSFAEEIVSAPGYYEQRKKEDNIDPSTLQQYTTLNEGQLNTNFEIALPYDISSNGELHSVTIKNEEISCNLKNYAVPRVDKEAYLLAEIADWQNLDLLPGDANIIMDDTYIGKSMIDPNSTQDTLNLSLGKDKRVAVKRSLVKEMSSLKSSGGSNRQVFTYEIIIKNNKLTDVSMLLKDQFPLSSIKEVEVKLDEAGDAAVNNETGVLTWKVNLKPGESQKFRFTYSVKYPKDKKIVNLR